MTIHERVAERFKAAAGYRVKRLEPETVIEGAGFKSPKGVTYAVVDQHGKVVKTINKNTRTNQYEIYLSKNTAQKRADRLNSESE